MPSSGSDNGEYARYLREQFQYEVEQMTATPRQSAEIATPSTSAIGDRRSTNAFADADAMPTKTVDLENSPTYARAKTKENEGKYLEALRLFHSIQSTARTPCSQLKVDINRVIDTLYGVPGSDETMSLWKSAPLMSKTKPPLLQFRAWAQMGRQVYCHGGVDFVESSDSNPPASGDRIWAFDIDKRTWRLVETCGKSPGGRSGHTMFAWKGDLYIWGGTNEKGFLDLPKLWRLNMTRNNGLPQWEIVKTRSQIMPPGREEHAGVLYKGKYYITCGNLRKLRGLANDTWVLNLSNFKWKQLKNGPIARHCHGMWAANDKIYVLGGRVDVDGPSVTFSTEHFVSFDLESKSGWVSEDIVGEDRPYDVSEYTVLPIYRDGEKEDPASIIVWGGFGYAGKQISMYDLKAYYGDQVKDFMLPYRKRLLRFDIQTNVWKKLTPTSDILPKAQSFATIASSEGGILHLLIGEGYGINPDYDRRETSGLSEELLEKLRNECPDFQVPDERAMHTPIGSNKVYEVLITESFGEASHLEQKGWSWDLYRCPTELSPRPVVDMSPWSPTLHHMFDLTCDDFLQPPCHSVLPNDNLLGVRVKIEGLLSRSDLNGKIARCGLWNDVDRYQVFLPACEGSRSLSVKPVNLRIADPVSRNELTSLMSTISLAPKRFPEVIMTINVIDEPSVCRKRPLLDVIVDPPDWKQESKCRPVTDTYRGPVSGSAQVILRTLCSVAPNSSSMMSCIFTAAVYSDSGSTKQAKMAKKFVVYSDFVKALMKRDEIRVKSFESEMAEIDDSLVRAKCGKSLKILVQLDGISPPIQRELLVSPEITLRCLHDQVLCPAMGWKSNYHAYAFRKKPLQSDCAPEGDIQDAIKDTCWIGPKVSTAIDSMFMPLYIGGCVANDKHITLGQLFVSNESEDGNLYVHYVHDLGEWWSHSITVSKIDGNNLPDNANNVAHLIGGQGGTIPEDVDGIMNYIRLTGQLTGQIGVECDNRTDAVDPSSKHWWKLLNTEVRSKPNMQKSLFDNPLVFHLEKTRADIDAALRRPTQKRGKENMNARQYDLRTGLAHELDEKCTAAIPKNATKLCAICGVTVSLRLCSVCGSVAYCGRSHQVQHWKIHKADCNRIQKTKQKK